MENNCVLGVFIGGTRSGKSDLAQSWLLDRTEEIDYVATLGVKDHNTDRVTKHRQKRPNFVTTTELTCGDQLLEVIAGAQKPLLIDSMGTWLTQYEDFCAPIDMLIDSLTNRSIDIAIVGELVGEHIHGATQLERLFVDRLGETNQRLQLISTHGFYVVAGGVVPIHRPMWDEKRVV